MSNNYENFTLRVMQIEDYEEVYKLWMTIDGFGIRSLDDSYEGVARFLRRNPTTSVVAEADGQIVEWDDYFTVGGEKMKAPSVGGSAKNVCKQEDFPLKLRKRTSLDAERVIPMPRKQASFHQMKLTGGLDLHLKTARRKQNLTF